MPQPPVRPSNTAAGSRPTSATPAAAPLPNIPDAQIKMEYAKKHNVHHLFELLAHRVLDRRPDDIFAFLRTQIEDIEAVEKRKNVPYDPTTGHHEKPSAASSSANKEANGVAPKREKKRITLGVFGLDGAGKTSMISCIGGAALQNTTPTMGYSPTDLETEHHIVRIFDLGGASTFRGVWPHYFHDCHGVLFVVDASDRERLPEAASVFKQLTEHEYIIGKPIAVACNKRDLAGDNAGAVTGPEGLNVANQIAKNTSVKISACCAVKDGDTGVDSCADWLLTTVDEQYEYLNALVTDQTQAVKQARKERLEAQRKRVEAAKAAEAAAANK